MTLELEGPWPDFEDLDVWTVDRLLDGSLSDGEVPAAYEPIAELVAVIREGVAPAESGWGSATVPAMAALLNAPQVIHLPKRRSAASRGLRRLPQVAATIGVVAALGSGVAAAANGSLPAPIQSAVHSAAEAIGMPILAPPPSHTVRVTSGGPASAAHPAPLVLDPTSLRPSPALLRLTGPTSSSTSSSTTTTTSVAPGAAGSQGQAGGPSSTPASTVPAGSNPADAAPTTVPATVPPTTSPSSVPAVSPPTTTPGTVPSGHGRGHGAIPANHPGW